MIESLEPRLLFAAHHPAPKLPVLDKYYVGEVVNPNGDNVGDLLSVELTITRQTNAKSNNVRGKITYGSLGTILCTGTLERRTNGSYVISVQAVRTSRPRTRLYRRVDTVVDVGGVFSSTATIPNAHVDAFTQSDPRHGGGFGLPVTIASGTENLVGSNAAPA